MKPIIMMLFGALTFGTATSQGVRLNFYSAYVFDDGFSGYSGANSYYNGKVKGGYQVGGGVEYMASPFYGVELLYQYKGTDAPVNFKFSNLAAERNETLDVNLNYILVSGNRYMISTNKKVEGYGSLMMGVLISSVKAPSTGGSSSNTNFAWGSKLGANIWVSPKLAVKLQTQILVATHATGGELYFSYWGPVEVPSYSTLWQFGLGGGLAFKLGN